MGYTTDFIGEFTLNKPLSEKMFNFLKALNETRRMKRNVGDAYGIDGEFYVEGGGSFGQDKEQNVVDSNSSPSTQPGLWCKWTPTEDGEAIEWDSCEKFYSYTEWLVYLIHKILAPNGYVLNGVVKWQGEGIGDVGKITVLDNRVVTSIWEGDEEEHLPTPNMRTDVVLILDGIEQTLLEEPKAEVEAQPSQDDMVKKFAKWLVVQTEDAGFTQAPCRRYKNKVYTVDELYDIFANLQG
jgi:hypothetical protein